MVFLPFTFTVNFNINSHKCKRKIPNDLGWWVHIYLKKKEEEKKLKKNKIREREREREREKLAKMMWLWRMWRKKQNRGWVMACTLRAMDDPLPTDVEYRTKNTVSAIKFVTFHFIFITIVFTILCVLISNIFIFLSLCIIAASVRHPNIGKITIRILSMPFSSIILS